MSRMLQRVWPAALLGVAAGAVILGLGGRVAMRVIAVQNGAPAILTASGTTTVVLAGAASGIAGVLLHLVADRLMRWMAPRHRWVRRVLFASLLLLITLRGLHPVQTLSLALFTPLVAIYGILIEIIATRREARTAARQTPLALPA